MLCAVAVFKKIASTPAETLFESMLRYVIAALAVLFTPLNHAGEAWPALNPANIPPGFTARYTVKAGGLDMGELKATLRQHDASHWTYHCTSSASGLAAVFVGAEPVTDTVRLQLFDNVIKPVSYRHIRKTGRTDKSEQVIYQWQNQLAKTRYKDRRNDITLHANMTDKFTLQLLIMANINHIPAAFTVPVISRAKLRQYQIVNLGAVKINTVYGQREAILVERRKGDSAYRVWADANAYGLPLQGERIKEGKTEYRAYLTGTSLITANEDKPIAAKPPQSSYYRPE